MKESEAFQILTEKWRTWTDDSAAVKKQRESDWHQKVLKKNKEQTAQDEGAVYEQMFKVIRKKTAEWSKVGEGERFSKFKLETEVRAIKGVTIVRVEDDTTMELTPTLESTFITVRFKPYKIDSEVFLRAVILPGMRILKKYGVVSVVRKGRMYKWEQYETS